MVSLNKCVDKQLALTAEHIAVSKKLRKAMLDTKPLYDKAKAEQQLAIRMKFAKLIGKENGIEPIMTNRGDVGFDRKTKKGDAARKMLSYYFPSKVKPATPRKKKVSKQVDVVEQLLEKLYSLSKAEQARFRKLLASDSK